MKPSFLVLKNFPQSATVVITSNLAIRAWSIKCREKKKLLHNLVENYETNILNLISL